MEEEEARKGFTFFESFAKALRYIKKKADRADAYDAICNYALYGIEPDMNSLPDAAAIAFELIKPNLDASKRKAKSGKQGGSKTKANSKQTEREKENEIEIENEIENECLRKQAELAKENAGSLADGESSNPLGWNGEKMRKMILTYKSHGWELSPFMAEYEKEHGPVEEADNERRFP